MKRIVVELGGGLGNQSYMLLAAQSLANRFEGAELYFMEGLQFGQSSHGSLATEINLCRDVKKFKPSAPSHFHIILMFRLSRLFGGAYVGLWNRYCWISEADIYAPKKPIKGDVFIRGYFQTSKYALEWRSTNSLEMRKVSPRLDEVSRISASEKVLCMHVRRGDYASHEDSHGLVPLRFYEEAVKTLANSHGHPSRIWVFSDDIDFCKRELPNYIKSKFEFPELIWSLTAEESFVAFSKGHLLITGNSTFSILAATLSEAAAVISPDPPFRGTSVSPDFYPGHFQKFKLDWD